MLKKKLAVLLAVAMLITMLPMTVFATGLSDMPNNWSVQALESAVSNGLLNGNDGNIMPDENLTRAQTASIVNRAFGATEKASLSSYIDVAADSWYYSDMAKAVQMGTFVGYDNKLNPDSYITRQEAFLVLARAIKLPDGNAAALDSFQDKDSVSSWAKGAVSAMTAAGYVNGLDGKMNPLANITRAKFAQIMNNVLKGYISTEGIYTSVPSGNVMINVPNVTLKDVIIKGDLVIGDGVGDGNVTLDSVTVTGRVVIRGGGVNSIEITGTSNLQNIVIARVDGQVRVYNADGTEVGKIIIDGKDDVIIQGNVDTVTLMAPDVRVTTYAEITSATIEGENSQIIVAASSTINTISVAASNTVVDVSGNVTNIVVNGERTAISGSGNVGSVAANANNVIVTTSNTDVTAAAGITGVIAGTTNVAGGTTVNTNPASRGSGGSSGGDFTVAPTVASLSPNSGPAAGGTSVTIMGSNFTGATAVSFGGTAAVSYTVDSSVQISAAAPAHAAGAADVTVTTPGGTATASGAYTYIAAPEPTPAPTITAISPASGPAAGGAAVSITGANFMGATAVSFGGTAAASYTIDSSAQISAMAPAHAAGAADVTVTTPGGIATASGAYTYIAAPEPTPAPTITAISPASGPAAGGTAVSITGANFTGATAVSFGGTAAVSYIVDSSTQISAVAPAHAAGAADVTVTTPGGTATDTGAYTYIAAPTITTISPASGPVAGGTVVSITGADFTGATAVSFDGTATASYTVDSSAQISAVAPAHAAGAADVTVTTPGGTATGTGAYTYAAAPTITAISPASGPAAGGTTVSITGTDFTGATAVSFGGTAAASYTVDSSAQISAVAPAHAAGAADVTVTTPGGTATGTGAYTYIAAPTITAISPISGPTFGGTAVIITGTDFTGATAVSFGGTAAVSYTVDSPVQISAVAPAHAAGAADVTVTTPGGTATGTGVYTYVTIPVYGSIYQLATLADATIAGGADVPFSNNGPLSGITHTAGTTTFTVPETGTYQIDYSVNVTGGAGSAVALTVNGSVYASTCISVLNVPGGVSGSAMLNLTTGDVITLRNNSITAMTLSLAPSLGAQICIDKLDAACGYGYQLANAVIAGGADVPFSNNGPLSGVAHTAGTTTFTVVETGTYKIDYDVNITSGVNSAIAIAVNGTVDASTNIKVLAAGGVSGSAMLNLTAGDVITLRNNSATAMTLSPVPSVGAQMCIDKLDATYGYGYLLANAATSGKVNQNYYVLFEQNGPLSGVTKTQPTFFTVTETGTYKIDYNLSITAGSAIALAVNLTVDASTNIKVLAAGGVSGSAILNLTAGDTIRLCNNSETQMLLSIAPSVGAQINIVKLN